MNILQKLPAPSTLSRVLRAWPGQTVVCIAGGPSLTAEQCASVGIAHAFGLVRVIAVNDAYRLAPFAEVCYFADGRWWAWHKDKPDFVAFAGQKCSIVNSGKDITDSEVHILRNAGAWGISTKPDALITGRNSGYQALNMAILAGAAKVVLLGYDGREPGPGEATHWFGDHPRVEPTSVYREYRQAMARGAAEIAAAGVEVINCSPGSAIDTFRKLDLAAPMSFPPGYCREHFLADLVNKEKLTRVAELGLWKGRTFLHLLLHCLLQTNP